MSLEPRSPAEVLGWARDASYAMEAALSDLHPKASYSPAEYVDAAPYVEPESLSLPGDDQMLGRVATTSSVARSVDTEPYWADGSGRNYHPGFEEFDATDRNLSDRDFGRMSPKPFRRRLGPI